MVWGSAQQFHLSSPVHVFICGVFDQCELMDIHLYLGLESSAVCLVVQIALASAIETLSIDFSIPQICFHYYIVISRVLPCLKAERNGGETGDDKDFPFPIVFKQLGLGKAEGRSLEFHLGLLCGWQGSGSSSGAFPRTLVEDRSVEEQLALELVL